LYLLFLCILSYLSTQKKHNTYGVDLHTTRITQGRLTPTLGYQRYNAYSVELQSLSNMRHDSTGRSRRGKDEAYNTKSGQT